MKRTFHLCLSSDNEVMFRDEDDYHRGFNCFALALYKTNSTGLVESFMSNHVHFIVQTDSPDRFMAAYRMPYTKYFNHKYSRTGRLGEPCHFTLEIKGLYHHLAAMSYVLRNPLHHGIAPIPYTYPHSSANAIFQKEMGKRSDTDLIPQSSFYRHIGRHSPFPDTYKMNQSGVFLRETVLDIPQVENMYVTPRNFDFYMNRKTSEDWSNEQSKDHNDTKPVTLETIESKTQMTSLSQMLIYESGRSDYRRLSDMDLCKEIDTAIQNNWGKVSIYTLPYKDKIGLAEELRTRYHLGEAQLYRCLAMGY